MKSLPLAFFNRSTLGVARDLIGCHLCIKRSGATRRYTITETEAYDGFEDMASHASRGKTRRNEVMFRRGGYIYVYFTYGIHWMLNIVTGPKDYPAAVLIRGVRDGSKSDTNSNNAGREYDGPAKLTKALGITGAFNGKKLSRETGMWIEQRKNVAPEPKIITTPRIGVDYSGPVWSKKHYRFVLDH